ncbi:MAG TPA: restriction endonuclease subunit S [Thermoanaerobaculia bacterium]|nr:restriction endonuclease subunit S [Thermoanaerobaculia bacterium]
MNRPEGWAEASLESLVVHALGGEWGEADLPETAADPASVRVRVVRGTEFRAWEREKGATAVVRRIARSRLARRRLAVGDLVVETSGGGIRQPVGRTLRIDEAALAAGADPLVCSNFCRQVRLHPEVRAAFVQLALTHLYLDGRLDAFQTQTTNLRNLDFPAFLSGVTLPLPPAAEQERIARRAAQLLARTGRVRERLEQVGATVKRLRQSVLAAAFDGSLTADWRAEPAAIEPFFELLARRFALRQRRFEAACREAAAAGRRPPRRPRNLAPATWQAPEPLTLPPLPAGWALVALGDVLERVQQGTSVRTEATVPGDGGIPVLRMPNIQDGEIDLRDLKTVPPEAVDLPNLTLRRGDILFNRTNSPELVGKAAVFEVDRTAIFASYLLRLVCDERLVVPRYVCYWINSPWGRAWARAVRTDCVSQSNINGSKLLAMPLPAPPLAEQREIVRRIEALFGFAARTEERLAAASARVERLPRAILSRALAGELVATEAEIAATAGRSYEPAADLLRRVMAETGQAARIGRRSGSGRKRGGTGS